MITIEQLARRFEDGLNERLGEPEIQFKIWAVAGERTKSIRNGNTIIRFITGDIKTTGSAMEANALMIGVNGLSLEFSVPIQRPRTNAGQTVEELRTVQDGQYVFPLKIIDAINGYFQTPQTFELLDADGMMFSVGVRAGMVVPGLADLSAWTGNHIPVSVYVECNFIKNGLNSKSVSITVDNLEVPLQTAKPVRRTESERDVYAGALVSKSIASSTGFSLDLTFPANADRLTKDCLAYLLHSQPNEAHFVRLKYGDYDEQTFLMILDGVTTSAGGIDIVGMTVAFIETAENVEMLSFPDTFQVGRFTFEDTQSQSVQLTGNVDCNAFICGKFYALVKDRAVTVPLTGSDFEYDETTDKYYVYLVSDTEVNITGSAPFEVM